MRSANRINFVNTIDKTRVDAQQSQSNGKKSQTMKTGDNLKKIKSNGQYVIPKSMVQTDFKKVQHSSAQCSCIFFFGRVFLLHTHRLDLTRFEQMNTTR